MQRMCKMITSNKQIECGSFHHDSFKSILINRIKSLGFNKDYILLSFCSAIHLSIA